MPGSLQVFVTAAEPGSALTQEETKSAGELLGETGTDASPTLLEWDTEEDLCCPDNATRLPELPAMSDTVELLGLPLAVYPGETEGDPRIQVHPQGQGRKQPRDSRL